MLYSLYSYLTYFFVPSICAACKIVMPQESILCTSCKASLQPVVSISLPVTKKYAITVFALSHYQDPIKLLILAKTYRDIVASYELAKLMLAYSGLKHVSFDYIVPVPLHWTRYAWRSYNQAHEIAKVLAKQYEKPIVHLIKRTKRTPLQSYFSKEKRMENVKDAFSLSVKDKSTYKDKTFLLVDDLMTTGATLQSVAKQLIKLQPKALCAVVAARGK